MVTSGLSLLVHENGERYCFCLSGTRGREGDTKRNASQAERLRGGSHLSCVLLLPYDTAQRTYLNVAGLVCCTAHVHAWRQLRAVDSVLLRVTHYRLSVFALIFCDAKTTCGWPCKPCHHVPDEGKCGCGGTSPPKLASPRRRPHP